MSRDALRLVVLISGNGSNLQAIMDAIAAHKLNAEIVLVVSNRRDAYGLVRAAQANIPTAYMPLKPFTEAGLPRAAYEHNLGDAITLLAPDYVVMAGWMHILGAEFLDRFPQKVINLHPALPEMFNGTHAIERAYQAWQEGEITYSGCMVHYAIPDVDMGKIITWDTVGFLEDDTLESFSTRLHAAERRTLIQALAMLERSR